MKKERVLAYTLAKEVENKDLAEISGGGAQMTSTQTVKVTGSSGESIEINYDISADW